MRPELFSVEAFGVAWSPSSYAVLYALAFAAAGAVVLAPRRNREEFGRAAPWIALLVVAGGYAFARLTKPWVYGGSGAPEGGTYFFGWAAGSVLALWAAGRAAGWNLARLFDALAPGVLLGSAIGRVGCLLAGCCGGIPAEPPLGWWFEARGAYLLPTQLLQSLADLLALAVLLLVVRPRVRREGALAAVAALLYAALRFPIELLRDEPDVALGMHQGQVIGLALALGTAAFLAAPRFARVAYWRK